LFFKVGDWNRAIEALKTKQVLGSADTSQILIHEKLIESLDNPRILVVTRDKEEVARSLENIGVVPDTNLLSRHDRELKSLIASGREMLVVKFEEVASRAGEIWEYLLPSIPGYEGALESVKDYNIQFHDLVKYVTRGLAERQPDKLREIYCL
jgi:hypothetical protein